MNCTTIAVKIDAYAVFKGQLLALVETKAMERSISEAWFTTQMDGMIGSGSPALLHSCMEVVIEKVRV